MKRESLDRQRQQFVADLDRTEPDYVEGVPQHDFTAVGAHGGYASDVYNCDPFAHAANYDCDTSYYHGSEPAAHGYTSDYPTQDQPTQEYSEGYADLHRGNSGSSHGSHGNHYQEDSTVRPSDFPTPDQYIGRPTHGGDGP